MVLRAKANINARTSNTDITVLSESFFAIAFAIWKMRKKTKLSELGGFLGDGSQWQYITTIAHVRKWFQDLGITGMVSHVLRDPGFQSRVGLCWSFLNGMGGTVRKPWGEIIPLQMDGFFGSPKTRFSGSYVAMRADMIPAGFNPYEVYKKISKKVKQHKDFKVARKEGTLHQHKKKLIDQGRTDIKLSAIDQSKLKRDEKLAKAEAPTVTPKVTPKARAGTNPKPKTKPMSRPEKIARVAIGQGEKGRRTGVALRNKKTGKLTGVSKKDQAIAKGARVAAGTAVAAGTLAGMSGGDKSYTIKSGDTLSQIAKKYGTTLGKLLDANPKFRGKDAAGRAKANRIKPGQKISLSEIVSPRKSVYQDTTKKEMAGMQMPKVKRKGGGRVGVGAALKGYGAVR